MAFKQRLAAILAADAAGYSRLMAADARATVMALDTARVVFQTRIESHGGRVIDMAGDSVLAVFETATGAVAAGLQIQSDLAALGEPASEERRMRFRIGVHLGDVIEKPDGTVYGDGVNIAARLQALADSGGMTVSDAIHGAVRGKVPTEFEDQGEQRVKNIGYPVRAHRALVLSTKASSPSSANTRAVAVMLVEFVDSGVRALGSAPSGSEQDPMCWSLAAQKVDDLGGRIFRSTARNRWVAFTGALDAVRCAAEIRSALAGADGPGQGSPRLRFGLHLAELQVDGEDLQGDGIRFVADLVQSAEPDTVLVSASFFEQIHRNSPFVFDDLGVRRLGHGGDESRVFRLHGEIGAFRMQSAPTKWRADMEKRPSSVAVLPFRVSGQADDQRFLAEGIADELIVELGRFRRLFCVSRSASFAFADSTLDAVSIGNALAVRHVLEGQIRRVGAHIRIGLTLTETETGTVAWSDKVTRPFDEIATVLDELTATIAATVFGRVEDASMVAARRKPPKNMTAFECLLRGMAHHRLGGVTEDHIREAVKWFDKAIEADPNYSAAHAWRVCSASGLPDFDVVAGEKGVRLALELDPNDAEALRIMATFELWNENHERAAALIRKAMELNPTDAYMKARCAGISTYTGEAHLSLSLLDEAESLDPFLPVWCIEERGVALYALGRYEEALKSHDRLAFQTWRSRLYRAASLVALNRSADARKLVTEAIVGRPGLTVSAVMANERYRDPEQRRGLRKRLEKAGLPR